MLSSAWVLTARRRQTSLGGLWLPLERWCVLPASPVGSCLVTTAKHEREKEKRGGQVGPLNSDELSPAESCEGKQKKGSERYALTWDGSQQHSVPSVKKCGKQVVRKSRYISSAFVTGWRLFFLLLDNNEGPGEWKGFNETECDRKCQVKSVIALATKAQCTLKPRPLFFFVSLLKKILSVR